MRKTSPFSTENATLQTEKRVQVLFAKGFLSKIFTKLFFQVRAVLFEPTCSKVDV